MPAYLGSFIALGWLHRRRGPLTVGRAVAVGFGVNLITHPLLWGWSLAHPGAVPRLGAEVAVALVEGALILLAVGRRGRHPDSWLNRAAWSLSIAVGVNTLSLLVGLLVLPSLLGAR